MKTNESDRINIDERFEPYVRNVEPFQILTCKIVPDSHPLRGNATPEGFNASAWSARLT